MLSSVGKICEKRGPLLLALSGGSDSFALYHLMLETKHPFEVIHVDHGWREESGLEAEELASKVQVPFHLHRLQKPQTNREDAARQERLSLYKKICEERNLEGVLLGHHADDQAETVLKRLFEGARLTKLSGLEREKIVENVLLLRPLLDFRKKQLISYLENKGESWFREPPSDDLRNRMRRHILPILSEYFGKEIVPVLCRLAEDAKRLRVEKENFWLQENVSDFFENQKVAISRPTLHAVLDHLSKGSRQKTMVIGKGKLLIDGGTLVYNKRIDEES